MSNKRKIAPIPGCCYTLAQVLTELDLLDMPCLQIIIGNKRGPLQDNHITEEELLSVPGIDVTRWTYIRTTREWIPVFHAVDDMEQFVEYEPYLDFDGTAIEGSLWITPKGFPRQQYYVREMPNEV